MGRRFDFTTSYLCRTALCASLLVGCASQVDLEYKGEPLATLRGVVEANGALQSRDDLVAAIVWTSAEPPPNFKPKLVGSRVAIRGSFPAAFTLDLYEPPPPEAQRVTINGYTDDSGKFWPAGDPLGTYTGLLAAIDANADMEQLEASDILGIDREHMLVYLSDDVPLPATPPGTAILYDMPMTFEEMVLIEKQVVVTTHRVPPVRGYHLAKANPANKDRLHKLFDCVWDGLCVSWRTDSDPSYTEHNYARCTERFPDNPTCSAWEKPNLFRGETEPASSVECRQRYGNREHCFALADTRSTPFMQMDGWFTENPRGFEDPISLDIGSTMLDFGL